MSAALHLKVSRLIFTASNCKKLNHTVKKGVSEMAEKTKKKAPLIFAVTIVLLLLLSCRLISGISFRELYCHFYSGSHLRCEVILTADGKPVPLNAASVSALPLSSLEENTISGFEQTDTGCKVACKGGEYGEQPFQLSFQTEGMTEPLTVAVTPIVGDCWEISDVTVTISADTAAKTITWSSVMRNGKEEYERSGELTFEEAAADGIRFSNI